MADDELPCTQIVACRRYSLTIRRSEQFLHPLHPSVRHRLVIMQGIGRDGRHLTGGDPGTCLVVAGSERQGKPARARAAQRHLMIQYDRLTMVKQLHANYPCARSSVASLRRNAMPPGGEGLRAVNSQGNRDRAVAIQLQRERGVAGGFADAAEVVKHRRRELNQGWRGVIH